MTEKMFLSPCHRKIKLKRSVHVNQVQNWLQRVRPKGEVTSGDFTWDYAMNSHLLQFHLLSSTILKIPR